MRKLMVSCLILLGSVGCGTSAMISLPIADGTTMSATGKIIYDKTTYDEVNGLTYIFNPRLKLNMTYGTQRELPFNEGNITYGNLCHILGYSDWNLRFEKTTILAENIDSVYIEGPNGIQSEKGPWSFTLASRSWTGNSGKREAISVLACKK